VLQAVSDHLLLTVTIITNHSKNDPEEKNLSTMINQ